MGVVRLGRARLGMAGRGMARQGVAGLGWAWQGRAWHGEAGQGLYCSKGRIQMACSFECKDGVNFLAYCHQPEICIPAGRCMGGRQDDNEIAAMREAQEIAHNLRRIHVEEGCATESELYQWWWTTTYKSIFKKLLAPDVPPPDHSTGSIQVEWP